MAIARLSVGTGSKGKASPHAQYIAREGKYQKESNSQEKLENKGHGNMPKWAEKDPNFFWKMADEHERKNGSTYREHVIALPRELDENQRHELIKDWVKNEIGDKHAYQYAIHNPPSMDGGEQPHAHIMFSERTIDGIERDPDQFFKRYNGKNPEKGGAKKANTGMKPADRKAELKAQRERWEKTCNVHLERAGSKERISMKSHKERGIQRPPINLSMKQLKDPKIKGAYQVMLDTKRDYRDIRRQTYREIQPKTALAEQAQERAEAEQAPPKTVKEFVERLSKEKREQVKARADKTISQYGKDINDKAIELYEKATPPNQRAKPLFSHYSYSDLKEVQPYKALAQQEIEKKDPRRSKDYNTAIMVTEAVQQVEREEGYKQQVERLNERGHDKNQDRDR